ncbi:uncharacterized protein PODANS_3_920 [Podospora anserina S mat+]|uniref:Podospora anserina S mat+ genomic DNA chromosome 3, supercontig 1 n=1 Tax=Podospora anserina (strain S / ATCC MYA-4624 / DSM 980 / FGSC 10383) TaxID=515849 RepID=B2ACG0_PODAN|nr:uncharacterized protein PODANS_3_920 [Podospora anserina S mat+]CAP61125.1 unnamed protein product [Podospora anserina S mat+]CDP26576.1 Putative protein of unknown function [Podospora anserina S mat+]
MSVFVNYGGPKLDKKQKQLVRSQAMVSVRGQQKLARAANAHQRDTGVTNPSGPSAASATVLSLNPRRLAPAIPTPSTTDVSEDSEDSTAMVLAKAPRANTSRKRAAAAAAAAAVAAPALVSSRARHAVPPSNIRDMCGAPPLSTHSTGVSARTFQDYLSRCNNYSSYLDQAFVLVGFKQPSYFRPDMSKSACIYIGWLLTAGVLDAYKGRDEMNYPYYEYRAVSELQKFIDGAEQRELHEVVYPVVVLSMFEMVRLSPRAITHSAAVEMFIKSRGGLAKMPVVMQHLVVMGDMLQGVSLDAPLAFNILNPVTSLRAATVGPFEGQQFRSSPFLMCDADEFDLANKYVQPHIHGDLPEVLQSALDSLRRFFKIPSERGWEDEADWQHLGTVDLDRIIDQPWEASDISGLFLETCALTARIMRRTLLEGLDAFDDGANKEDLQVIYENVRFIGLKAWVGLPYIYVWVNLIGFEASTDIKMKAYFVAEVVRCAFSYGCYQMEIFHAILSNFLSMRNALKERKFARIALTLGDCGFLA